MATGKQAPASVDDAATNDSIQPFRGVLSPGICFSSGHCFCLYKWWDTPTSLDEYESVWLITPEGERRLYGDSSKAATFVQKYHEFDRVSEAEISWNELDEGHMECSLEGDDGTSVELQLEFGSSVESSLLDGITTLTPKTILRTSVGEKISNLTFSLLMETNGLKVAGITDTGEPYRVESDSIRMVTGGSARVDGEDCGTVGPPVRPVEFGDAIAPNDPFVSFGELWLRPPSE